MKRLNPLYVILLLLTIVFISFFVLNDKKEQFFKKIDEYKTVLQKSKEYKNLKLKWSNKKYVQKVVNQIIGSSRFRNEKIIKTQTHNMIKIRIESKNQKILDEFLNKFLNKPLIIKKLNIEKNFIDLQLGVK